MTTREQLLAVAERATDRVHIESYRIAAMACEGVLPTAEEVTEYRSLRAAEDVAWGAYVDARGMAWS